MGTMRRVLAVAKGLADLVDGHDGVEDAFADGFYMTLLHRGEARRLLICRVDRRPTAEEAMLIGAAAGMPEGSEPVSGRRWVTCADVPTRLVLTMEFSWRELPTCSDKVS